jgi:Integral membrane protein S linking to the trans Golgi network
VFLLSGYGLASWSIPRDIWIINISEPLFQSADSFPLVRLWFCKLLVYSFSRSNWVLLNSCIFGSISLFLINNFSADSAFLLSIIVERSKKCVDFTVTMYIIHVVCCIYYIQVKKCILFFSFSSSSFWLFLHIYNLAYLSSSISRLFGSGGSLQSYPLLFVHPWGSLSVLGQSLRIFHYMFEMISTNAWYRVRTQSVHTHLSEIEHKMIALCMESVWLCAVARTSTRQTLGI